MFNRAAARIFLVRVGLTAVCTFGLFLVANVLFPLPSPRPYSPVVEDRNGKFIQAFRASDGIWRLRTSPDEIPERLKAVLLAKEDRWFYYHPGINPAAIIRAIVQNVVSGRRMSGASTITMQIARMLEPKERTYAGKLVELFRALQLEWKYSKDELLGMYLSTVPLGGNIEGLRSASLFYYQTPLERLNIAHLIDLILVPNDPNSLRPDLRGEALFASRIKHASMWQSMGLLSHDDSLVIWSTPAAAVRTSLPREAPQFAARVRSQRLAEPDVRSSLDLDLQHQVASLLTQHLRMWKRIGVNNGAVIVVDNATREIRAYVGTGDFDDETAGGQVDAIRALRSPGSTLKPFLYALEMEKGLLTPHTMLLDTPYDAEGFYAENYDGTYSGMVYATDALQRSLNVPMVRLLKKTGLTEFLDQLGAMGFGSLSDQRPRLGLSMILGGCGVTLEELAAAYATFPNGGIYRPLRFVHGTPVDSIPDRRVFSNGTAYMVTDILSGLERPDLPNNFESSITLPKVAFKTGTSYGRRDAWSMGYSAEYTVGVWIGNVSNRGNPELVGSKSAAPLLVDVFTAVTRTPTRDILPAPRDLRIRKVCALSGLPPSPQCTRLIDDYATATTLQSRVCDVCREVLLSPDHKTSYCSSCLGNHSYVAVTMVQYAPELLHFWNRIGVHNTVIPPHNPECATIAAGEGPKIVSPTDRMTYYLDARAGGLPLQAGSGSDVHEHRWYLDSTFLGTRKPGDKLFVNIAAGEHTVACLDDRGRMSSVRVTIRSISNNSF
jgi:penicillin-binding protein 1C